MINLLDTVTQYTDSWNATFYYVAVLALLIGIFWTYLQVFVKPLGKKKKKEQLKENIIYHNSEDVIENYNYDKKEEKSFFKRK